MVLFVTEYPAKGSFRNGIMNKIHIPPFLFFLTCLSLIPTLNSFPAPPSTLVSIPTKSSSFYIDNLYFILIPEHLGNMNFDSFCLILELLSIINFTQFKFLIVQKQQYTQFEIL